MVGGWNSLRTKDPHEKVNNFHHQNFIHNVFIHCHYSLLHFHTIKQKLLHIFLANLKQETWSKEQRGMTGGFQRVTSDCSGRGSLKICLDCTDTAERRRLQLLGWCCGIWRINFLILIKVIDINTYSKSIIDIKAANRRHSVCDTKWNCENVASAVCRGNPKVHRKSVNGRRIP